MKNLGKLSACVAAASLVFAMSACSGGSNGGSDGTSDQGQNNGGSDAGHISGTEDTVDGGTLTINGVDYTCEEALGLGPVNGCPDEAEQAFLQYKGNLAAYMNSGKLGMFNADGTFEDVAYAGMSACIVMMQGRDEDVYIDSMRNDPKLAAMADKDGMSRTAFLPAWFEAQKSLCPDLASNGYRSHDLVTP